MTQAARTRPAPIPDVANEDQPEAGYSPVRPAQESSSRQESSSLEAPSREIASREPRDEAPPHYDLIELLFFAYRDFVADPDRILAEYGFGRAHHRVLHFVDRHPGLTIAELLDILRITKQSLNRVLKELIEQGYIAQRTGTSDRRHRLLTCTPQGRALAQRLAGVQGERVRRAADTEHWAAFQGGFRQVGEMLVDTATGQRGGTPDSVVLLSGDVHHSYVAEAWPDPASESAGRPGPHSRVLQAVCSPIRNPLPPVMKAAIRLASRGRARPTGRLLGRRIPRSPLHWEVTQGPWVQNLLAVLEVEGPELRISWSTGDWKMKFEKWL